VTHAVSAPARKIQCYWKYSVDLLFNHVQKGNASEKFPLILNGKEQKEKLKTKNAIVKT
jgi:hypothetical protein